MLLLHSIETKCRAKEHEKKRRLIDDLLFLDFGYQKRTLNVLKSVKGKLFIPQQCMLYCMTHFWFSHNKSSTTFYVFIIIELFSMNQMRRIHLKCAVLYCTTSHSFDLGMLNQKLHQRFILYCLIQPIILIYLSII